MGRIAHEAVNRKNNAHIFPDGGGAAIPFKLVQCENEKAAFENPDHDFPQRIVYWIDEEGLMHAHIEGKQKGKERFEEWVWRPAPMTKNFERKPGPEVREKK